MHRSSQGHVCLMFWSCRITVPLLTFRKWHYRWAYCQHTILRVCSCTWYGCNLIPLNYSVFVVPSFKYLLIYLQSSLRAVTWFPFTPSLYRIIRTWWGWWKGSCVSRLEQGERVLRKAFFELCAIYPGDIQICQQITAPTKSFSLRLDDFSVVKYYGASLLSPVYRISCMIRSMNPVVWRELSTLKRQPLLLFGNVRFFPRWLQDLNDPESTYEGGSTTSRQALRALFFRRRLEIGSGKKSFTNGGNLSDCLVIGYISRSVSGLRKPQLAGDWFFCLDKLVFNEDCA